MTDEQFNHLNMVFTVLLNLGETQYASIITGSTKLAARIATVTGTHNLILTTAGLQSLINKGPTVTKESLFQAAASISDDICNAVKAFADETDNETLLDSMHFSYKGLLATNASQALIDMQTIHDTAAGLDIADLEPFNIVAADITAQQAAIDAFKAGVPAKRVMVVQASVATADLPPLFTLQRKQLKKLDNMVRTFRRSQPQFFEAHFKARKIINYGKTMRAEELHLVPLSHEAIFGKKFKEGNFFLIRNHTDFDFNAALTDTPDVLPTTNLLNVPAQTQIKAEISKGFGGVFGHWLVIINPHSLDDVHATVILSLGPDKGSANIIMGKVK